MLPVAAFAGFLVVDEPVRPAVPPVVQSAPGINQVKTGAAVVTAAPSSPGVQPGPGAIVANAPATVQGFSLLAVTYVGQPPADIEVRRGFGRKVKFTEALKQIAPPGWHGRLTTEMVGRVEKGRLVDWRGGRRWVEILDILATEQNVSAEVDWTRREILIGEKRAFVAPSSTVYTAAVKPAPPKPIWQAKQGSTLKASVQEWGKKAGWEVVWGADYDYPIEVGLTFDGSFLDAITTLFRSYDKAEKPFVVDVHQKQTPPVLFISARKQ